VRLQERLLRQIVSRVSVDQRHAGSPDIALGRPHEVSEGDCIAAGGCPRDVVQRRIHASNVTGNFSGSRDDSWS
jgi:hypothetical protein